MDYHEGEARVFVGSDRSQLLAVRVLEHSIRRNTDMKVTVRPMHDLNLPDPQDVRQGKRTGFSFTRFAIPQLTEYKGRAIYLDADMLVFRDFRELYSLPFDGAKVIIQEELPETAQAHGKAGAPGKRIKQCSVMLLDCGALSWDPVDIITGLDGKYTYEQLMYDLCLLDEDEIKYGVPFEWNSLEVFEPGRTGLIHYTDMLTQPWVSPHNKNGYLWLNEIRLMLTDGSLSRDELKQEIDLGFFRPSLIEEIDIGREDGPLSDGEMARLKKLDDAAGFVPHKQVYEAKRRRDRAVKEYESKLARESGRPAAAVAAASANWGRRVVSAIRRRLSA